MSARANKIVVHDSVAGFTLVELLVVIGTISLLVGILLPVANRAREQARTVYCLSNLRQIGQAITMYAQGQNGWLVPAMISGKAPPGKKASAPHDETWGSVLMYLKYLPEAKKGSTPTATSNWRSVLRCPSGVDARWIWGVTPAPVNQRDEVNSFSWRRGSYLGQMWVDHWYAANAMSAMRAGWLQKKFPMRCYNWQLTPARGGTFNKLNQIQRASEIALIFDGLIIHGRAARISARHNRKTTVNFLMGGGHCISVATSTLPQRDNDFLGTSAAGLSKYSVPRWRLDQ